MANILRFVILGDDRGGPAFATFTKQVEKANASVDRNNAALKRQGAASKKATGEVNSLSKAMDGLQKHGGPSWLGPLMLALPAIGTLGGVAAGAVIGLGGAFTAAAGSLAGFGAVAKPVLTDAKKAAEAVSKAQNAYNIAIANGTPKAAAYKTEQIAIARAYAGMSPAQIQLSKQLGAMADAWDKVKAAETPVVAGALQPWLRSVTDLMGMLKPIIDKIAPVIHDLGVQFDALVKSDVARRFRDFVATFGALTVKAAGSTLIDFFKAFMIILPQFSPLIGDAVKGIGGLGPAVLKWAGSKKTADHITAFMAWFKTNGPVVGDLLKNVGGALAALAPGLTSGGALELKVMSDFLGFVARLPPGLAKPLAEVAGAMLILNKVGVVKVGIKLTGLTGPMGGLLAGAGTAGGPLALAGAGIGAGFILSIKNAIQSGWRGVLRILPSLLGGVGGILNLSAKGWSDTILNHFATPVRAMWNNLGHFLASSFDVTRHQVAAIAVNLWHQVTGSFDKTRSQVSSIWNTVWNNTVSRAANGVRDVERWFTNLRGGAALAWTQIRATAASTWNTIWNNTVSRTMNGVRSVLSWVGTLPGRIRSIFAAAGNWLVAAGRNVLQGFWNGLTSIWGAVTKWISGIASWIKAHKGPVSLDASLLYPAGQALMGGLFSGLKAGFGPVRSFVGGIASWVLGKIKGAGGKLFGGKVVLDTSQFSGAALAAGVAGPGGGAPAANAALARRLMPAWGSGAEWAAWNALVMGESGWNQYARNPSSGAYGIPQALPASKMGAAANPPQSNPAAQIRWQIGYIRGTPGYGDPINTYAKWRSRSPHWYGYGGPFAAGQLIGVGDRGPEFVSFGRAGRVYSPEQSAALGGNTYNITVNVPPTASKADTGRVIVEHIRAYEQGSGKGWRR